MTRLATLVARRFFLPSFGESRMQIWNGNNQTSQDKDEGVRESIRCLLRLLARQVVKRLENDQHAAHMQRSDSK